MNLNEQRIEIGKAIASVVVIRSLHQDPDVLGQLENAEFYLRSILQCLSEIEQSEAITQ